MLSRQALKDVLHRNGLTKMDQLLICLAVQADSPKAVKDIKSLAKAGGLGAAQKWNISALLSAAKGLAARTDGGWELTAAGKAKVQGLVGDAIKSPAAKVATKLRVELKKIKDQRIAEFVEEAVTCFEHDLYRAAVVLTWVGAVAILYDHVLKNHLAGFNAEAKRRAPKWKDAKTADDLARMKEADFLDVLDHLSIIGKNVKNELKNRLDLRNACGHPNSLAIGENVAAAHVEALILNVYTKFTP